MHIEIEPKIMYFGTPVVLLSSLNEDGTPNIAPMSSAWWLRNYCVLGLGKFSQTFQNLVRERECVINLPSDALVPAIDRLALTTASSPIPPYKQAMGFELVRDKFTRAGLTPADSKTVKPPRVAECPVQLEAVVETIADVASAESHLASITVRVVRSHFDELILNKEKRHHVDTEKWRPLIMSFCEFYALGGNLHESRLAKVF